MKKDLSFKVHDIFSVELSGVPLRTARALEEELACFRCFVPGPTADVKISFVGSLGRGPGEPVFRFGTAYKDGTLYFDIKGARTAFPASPGEKKTLEVHVEEKMIPILVFQLVERLLYLKAIERGYCLLHASAILDAAGRAIVFAAGQGGGKTKWVLEMLENGRAFLGDDIIIADRQGRVYPYPRRLNIHPGHGKHFQRAKTACAPVPRALWIAENLVLSAAMQWLGRLSWGTRAREYVKSRQRFRNTFRRGVRELFPAAEVGASAPIGRIYFPAVQKDVFPGKDGYRRIAIALRDETRNERWGALRAGIEAFCLRDEEGGMKFSAYLCGIGKKEYRTIVSILRKSNMEVL